MTIARDIARALESAHDKGIIHRDLKPANIKITPDGLVKVLDFGLAKASADSASGHDATDATHFSASASQDGVLIGTAAYMSPEQARGEAIDKRTDIWSFGCVLYEMIAGRRAMTGATVSETLAEVLEREPDWTALPATTPPSIQRLVRRCLEKDVKRRLKDIGDARLEIEDALSAGDARNAVGDRRSAQRPRVARGPGCSLRSDWERLCSSSGRVPRHVSRRRTCGASARNLEPTLRSSPFSLARGARRFSRPMGRCSPSSPNDPKARCDSSTSDA